MADDRDGGRDDGRMHRVTRSLAKKALAPVAASLTAYVAKKLPELVEQKILPKVRERGGARAVAHDTTKRLGSTTRNAKDSVAEKVGLARHSQESMGGVTDARGPSHVLSDADRREARRRREQNRQARRKALT